jgi:hypothetical protein
MTFLFHLWTVAVDIGNTVLSGGGTAPIGRAIVIESGVGALDTFIG